MAEQFGRSKDNELDQERLEQLERARKQQEEAQRISDEMYRASERRQQANEASKPKFEPDIPGITREAVPLQEQPDPITELNGPLGRGQEKLIEEKLEGIASGKLAEDPATSVELLSKWIEDGEEKVEENDLGWPKA